MTSGVPQGTILLSGNRVTEHPSNGDEGGKFLFEVISGKTKSKVSTNTHTHSLSLHRNFQKRNISRKEGLTIRQPDTELEVNVLRCLEGSVLFFLVLKAHPG